jgi:hypothetical protein
MAENEETKVPTQKFTLPSGFDPLVRVVVPSSKPASLGKQKTVRVSLEGKVGSIVDARNYRGNGHWASDIEMGRSKAIGFIYVIRNLKKGRFYIGKKFYRSEGKLTKGQTSNWAWYISSCKSLAEDVKEQQKVGFDFIFIEEYYSRGALSWAETWSLCNAKITENTMSYYNTLINKVSWKVREKITTKHEERLRKALNGDDF